MRIKDFPGLVTDQEPFEVGLGGLVTAENIDLSKNNKPSRRDGFASTYVGATPFAWGDGHTFLFVEGDNLKSLQADGSATTVKELVATPTQLVGLRAFDNRLYWSTGTDAGVIEGGVNRPFGVLRPTAFNVEETTGLMPAAGYLLGLTYVNSRGTEGPMAYVGGSAAGGVSVTLPHTMLELAAQGIERVRLYVSYPDGEVLYRAAEITVGDASYIAYAGDTTDLAIVGSTIDKSNMPTDGLLTEFAGRLWTTTDGPSGSILVYSEPYSELTDLVSNFFPFPNQLAGVGGIDTGRDAGLYVGTTERVYFLQGTSPERMQAREVVNYGMIPGTLVKADGRVIGEGTNTPVYLWSSPRGICVGGPDGEVTNLTQRRVGTLTGHAGTAILRRANGQNHLMTVLRS